MEKESQIKYMKIILYFLSLLLMLSGFIILAVGLWLEIGLYNYLELPPEFSDTAPYVLTGIGGLIIFLTLSAFVCMQKNLPVFFNVYGGFVVCAFMMEMGVAVSMYCYKDKLLEGFNKGLNHSLINHHDELSDQKDSFDLVQTTLQCCGVQNYTDWYLVEPKVVPLSCCKNPITCVTSKKEDIHEIGCYNTIMDMFELNRDTAMMVTLGNAILPMITAILSCFIGNNVRQMYSKYSYIV